MACNNNGLTWGAPGYVLSENIQWGFTFSTSCKDSLINILGPYSIINDSVYYSDIRSINFGQSWTAPRIIFSEVQSPDCDQVSFNNLVYLIWAGRFDFEHCVEIYYIKSNDGGLTWSPNIPLSDTDQIHSQLPSIAINENGTLASSWMDYKYSQNPYSGDILSKLSTDSGGTWGQEIQITQNHYAMRSDILLKGDTIYSAWEDLRLGISQGSIYFSESVDGGINWSEPYWVDNDTNSSIDPAMAASNGWVYLIWEDAGINGDSSGIYFSRWDPEQNDIKNEDNIMPQEIGLTAYPNPFNSSTIISFSNLQDGEIRIFNITGSLIRILKPEQQGAGSILWNSTNEGGQKVTSGIYFARASSLNNSSVIKLIYLK